MLIFSVRHPIRTCNPAGEVSSDGEISWMVRDYFVEGSREFNWLGARCVNFHRPVSTYIQMLIQAGLTLEKVIEPSMPSGASELSAESESVPFFLTMSGRKSR